jgi:hypothetical protein
MHAIHRQPSPTVLSNPWLASPNLKSQAPVTTSSVNITQYYSSSSIILNYCDWPVGWKPVRIENPAWTNGIHIQRSHLSSRADWRQFLAWAAENRALLPPRAYSYFVLTWAGVKAARGSHWEAFGPLLKEAFKGRPSMSALLSYFSYWLIPERAGTQIALNFARLHNRFGTGFYRECRIYGQRNQ